MHTIHENNAFTLWGQEAMRHVRLAHSGNITFGIAHLSDVWFRVIGSTLFCHTLTRDRIDSKATMERRGN